MTVDIVAGACVGSGQCTLIAPQTFRRRIDGTAELQSSRPTTAEHETVLEAARFCPEGAIRVSPGR